MKIVDSYNLAPTDITREFYFNVGGVGGFMRWGIYIFMFIAVGYLLFTLTRRIKVWKLGKGKINTDRPFKRLIAVIKYVFFQKKILREGYAGIMHASIFFGFLGLFVVTMIIVVQEDLTALFFHYHFIHGSFYLIWSLAGDLFGLIVIIGLLLAIKRRYLTKPTRLDTKPTDTFALFIVVIIVITGFLNEAMRIAITGFPAFEVWSPVGWVVAKLFVSANVPVLEKVHYANWWFHMIAAFSFVGLIATEKLGHIVISTMNIFTMNLDNENPETRYTLPLIKPEEFETEESWGVLNMEELRRNDLLDSEACTRCGRCQDQCPAYLTEKPLSPKKMINDIRDNMNERAPLLLKAGSPGSVESTPLTNGAVTRDEYWSCTNCAACMEACPVNIEHVPKMTDMRRYTVLMEAGQTGELQQAFVNMENQFNPYGFGFAARGDWLPEDLGVKMISDDREVDYCYFVGCAASFDKRNQKVAEAFLRIMKKAGLKVGILGPEEVCCGDAAMRAGNEYLFHMLVTQNLETFKNYGIKKIVTTCPHGYNVLKKEYKEFAGVGLDSEGKALEYNFEVFHHSDIIFDLIKNGKIKLNESLENRITYHDSCFLGRYNDKYDKPREIIKSIPGTQMVEMSRNQERSFCCGAGGARMFIEEHLGTRINQFRTKDAQSSGAEKICTACPFCMTMLTDGATELDISNLETFDLAELVYNSMEK